MLRGPSASKIRRCRATLMLGASLLVPWRHLAFSQEAPSEAKKAAEPFAFADFTWLNGNSRTRESVLETKAFTGEFRVDTSVIYDFNHPQDHTLVGTSESGRTNEIQVQQLGLGGDF